MTKAEFAIDGAAALRVIVTSGSLVVTSPTYNLVGRSPWSLPEGASFGQFVPGLEETEAIGYCQEGRLIHLALRPSSELDGFRTNIGIVNASAIPIDVRNNVLGCSIDQGVGVVPCQGNVTVHPLVTTTFTLTASSCPAEAGGGPTSDIREYVKTLTLQPHRTARETATTSWPHVVHLIFRVPFVERPFSTTPGAPCSTRPPTGDSSYASTSSSNRTDWLRSKTRGGFVENASLSTASRGRARPPRCLIFESDPFRRLLFARSRPEPGVGARPPSGPICIEEVPWPAAF